MICQNFNSCLIKTMESCKYQQVNNKEDRGKSNHVKASWTPFFRQVISNIYFCKLLNCHEFTECNQIHI